VSTERRLLSPNYGGRVVFRVCDWRGGSAGEIAVSVLVPLGPASCTRRNAAGDGADWSTSGGWLGWQPRTGVHGRGSRLPSGTQRGERPTAPMITKDPSLRVDD